ncbi:MAG: 3-deoxy-7-phosphoheptulonate synthase [Elusimicrobia bacterium]|nr:MAG: 3-deoxy-7-phosphoheptulonate synthase [Elusimicrobiota bacterium]
MFLTLKPGTTEQGIEELVKKIEELGFRAHISRGAERTVIGVIGENAIAAREVFEGFFTVELITPISKPYKLVSREFKKEDTIVKIGDVTIGGKDIVVMAGPCSVEKEDLLLSIASSVKKAGVKVLRGGAFNPRTSPYSFQGLGERGLKYLAKAKKATGLLVVTEAMNIQQVELVSRYADIIQIGARNVQNFELLKEAGKSKKPILLKRGIATTIEEWLMSAEYIVSNGNSNVILCERGIRTFESATRFTLDLNAIPAIKAWSHLPVIVDPSHGTGVRDFVCSMSKAAIACGADGLIIEVHSDPEHALSDGKQSLLPENFASLMQELKKLARVMGRNL